MLEVYMCPEGTAPEQEEKDWEEELVFEVDMLLEGTAPEEEVLAPEVDMRLEGTAPEVYMALEDHTVLEVHTHLVADSDSAIDIVLQAAVLQQKSQELPT